MKIFSEKLRHIWHQQQQHEEESSIESWTENEFKRRAEEALVQAWKLLNSEDGWKQEQLLDNGDEVLSKYKGSKKLFKLTGIVELPPKLLLEELYYGIESVPSWNPTLDECKTIQPIDSHCDVSYQVAAEAAGGVVSTRDFVNLRSWRRMDCGTFVCSGVSVKHPAMPPQPKRVRGENGPTCWAMRAIPGCPDRCRFQWLLDTDLKGWIPQYVIDSALSRAQLDYIQHIRKHSETLKDSGRVTDHLAERLEEEDEDDLIGAASEEKQRVLALTT